MSALTRTRVPMAAPNIGPLEHELVSDALGSGTLSMGPFTREFEERLAEMAGRRFGIACSSGTAALHLGVRALGLSAGRTVITTPFSFVASSNCVLYEHATPRFVDIDEATLGLDPEAVDAAVDQTTDGIISVDVFGLPARQAELEEVAQRHGLWLLEDACEGLGSSLDGRPVGSFGNAATFAFYPNKQITTGEGGMVVTDDERLAEAVRSMRNQGRDADGTWLRHVQLGYNYRIDELSAALGVAQLRRFDELRAGRRRVAAAYDRLLAPLGWVTRPRPTPGADVDWFVYVVRVDERLDRDRLIGDMAEAGIPARPYFSPIHLQPFYVTGFDYKPGDFPRTERVASQAMALPFSSIHREEEVALVVEVLTEAAERQSVS